MRLQDLLRELGRTLDEAAGPAGGQPKAEKRPPAKSVEVRKTSGEVPEARSLEEDVQRPERAVVDADDEAEAIAARRSPAAEANARRSMRQTTECSTRGSARSRPTLPRRQGRLDAPPCATRRLARDSRAAGLAARSTDP